MVLLAYNMQFVLYSTPKETHHLYVFTVDKKFNLR